VSEAEVRQYMFIVRRVFVGILVFDNPNQSFSCRALIIYSCIDNRQSDSVSTSWCSSWAMREIRQKLRRSQSSSSSPLAAEAVAVSGSGPLQIVSSRRAPREALCAGCDQLGLDEATGGDEVFR
jgi:hypothetical protein